MVCVVFLVVFSILLRQVHLTGFGDYQLEGIEQRDLVARDNGQRLRGRAGRDAKAAASGADGMVDEAAAVSSAAASAAATPVYAMRVASRPTADRESLVALLDLDPFATQNEQSVITDEEMQAAGASGSAPRSIMFSPARGPKARGDGAASSSSAAAAAAMEAEEDDEEEYDDEDGDGDGDDDDDDDDADMGAAMGVRSAASAAAQRSAGRSVSFAAEAGPAARASGWGVASSADATANEDADFGDGDDEDGEDDVGSRKLIEAEKARSLRLLERDEMEFPDEVETPLDISARERFARYRGLQNFKTSPWDPYESLPLEYGRIIQFEHFAATAKAVLQSEESLLRAALFATGPIAPAAATLSSSSSAAAAAGASDMYDTVIHHLVAFRLFVFGI